MFNPGIAHAIIASGMLDVGRRTLFTSTSTEPSATSFQFMGFYQHGTAVVMLSHGALYGLTPSHVVRNATGIDTKNQYQNDSPVWVAARLEAPRDLMDFMFPMRIHDFAPGGNDELDAAILEFNPLVMKLGPHVDWDDESLFVGAQEDVSGSTAVAAGYPQEVNPYDVHEGEDGPRFVTAMARAFFRGEIAVEPTGTFLLNYNHKAGYEYSGLSGSPVVCATSKGLKYLGIVISIGDEGKRLKILRFAEIRAAAGVIDNLPWELIDEAFWLGSPTHSTMKYSDLVRCMMQNVKFVPQRTNNYLAQLARTRAHGTRRHWVANLALGQRNAEARVWLDFLNALKAVARLKGSAAF